MFPNVRPKCIDKFNTLLLAIVVYQRQKGPTSQVWCAMYH